LDTDVLGNGTFTLRPNSRASDTSFCASSRRGQRAQSIRRADAQRDAGL